MARIAGVDLPRDKRVEIGLTYIFGIGRTSADEIIKKTGVNPDTRCRDLTDDEVRKLSEIIASDYTVEGDLRRQTALDIKRLTEIGCYRGARHRKGLPAVDRRLRPMQELARVLRRLSRTRRSDKKQDRFTFDYEPRIYVAAS